MTSLARRLQGRFAELGEAGTEEPARRRVRWLTERLALIRSSEGMVAVAVAPVWQIAVFILCGICLTGAVAGLVVAGAFHEQVEHQAQRIAMLQAEAQAFADRTARDRQRLDRMSEDLSASTAERDRNASAAEAANRAVIERSRLLSEQGVAVERANEMLEQANADRRRLERERDLAEAKHDDLMQEFSGTLRELDGETRRTVADVEKIIAAAGIDPRVRPAAGLQRATATGGPYIPWPGPAPASAKAPDDAGVGQFELTAQRVERLKVLRDTLQQLPLVMPLTRAVIAGGFGFRHDPMNGGGAMHEGVDLLATRDPVVYAPGAGTVVSAGWNGQFGNMVELDHGFGMVTRYAHLSRITVRKGDVVARGQPMGVIGATGRATGVHLHYELRVAGRARDPLRFLRAVDVRPGDRPEPLAGFDHR